LSACLAIETFRASSLPRYDHDLDPDHDPDPDPDHHLAPDPDPDPDLDPDLDHDLDHDHDHDHDPYFCFLPRIGYPFKSMKDSMVRTMTYAGCGSFCASFQSGALNAPVS